MRRFQDVSIRTKLLVLLMGVVSVALVLSCAALAVNDVRMIEALLVKRMVTLADVLGANCTAALNFADKRTAEDLLDSLRLQTSVVYARVYDKDGTAFAEYAVPGFQHITPPKLIGDDKPFSLAGYLHVFRPIVQDGEQIGTVYLQTDKGVIHEQLRGYALVVAVALAVSLSVTMLLAFRVQRVISRPIDRLVEATQKVAAESDFSIRIAKEGNDELGLLGDAFNSMLSQIQQRDGELDQHRRNLEQLVHERTESLEARTRDLALLNAKLKRSNIELEQFAYISSHDLQEPLRKVQAFGDMLVSKYRDVLGDEGRDYLQRMSNAAERMKALINDLLTFSRVASKARPFEPVELSMILRGVLSDLETRIAQLAGRVDVGELSTLEADPVQMRQLLQNLIGNALKFHKPGEPPVVSVCSRILDNSKGAVLPLSNATQVCQITVRDYGIGFEQKYADRIFHPFERLHGRGEYEGTGIGLAVCQKIVERHSGVIVVQSELGVGTTFIVSLPTQQAKGVVADV